MSVERISGLRIYVQVVDAGSLSGAARVLGSTPTLVSRRLAQLEREVGVRLLQRTTRTLHITDEGRAFYRRARRILDELDDALDEVRPAEGARGTVRIVLGTITVAYGVMDALDQLLTDHPELRIQASFTDQPVDIVKGGWDIAVHLGLPPDSSHIARRMPDARACLGATAEYLARRGIPASPDDLANHECLRFIHDRPQTTWRLVGPNGEEREVPVGGRLEMDNSAALCRAMYAGVGIGLSPVSQLEKAFARGDLVPVLPGWRFVDLPLYALVPQGRHRVPRVRVVLDWMSEYLHALS